MMKDTCLEEQILTMKHQVHLLEADYEETHKDWKQLQEEVMNVQVIFNKMDVTLNQLQLGFTSEDYRRLCDKTVETMQEILQHSQQVLEQRKAAALDAQQHLQDKEEALRILQNRE